MLGLAFWGLWQIDMVRQTVRIQYLTLTGGLWKIHGRVETRMLQSKALGESRQVMVYLPPGYDAPANAARRYPALYILHGFPDPGDGWARFGLAPQIIDKMVVQNQLPPLLLVLPDSHGTVGKFGDGEYIDAPVGGRGTRLASYITGDVPPWVDAHYRTVATPAGRFVAGSSTGAYAAVNLGLKRPDIFGTVLALSGYYEADLKHFGRDLWGQAPDPARIARESPLSFLRTDPPLPGNRAQFVYVGDGVSDYRDVQTQTDALTDALEAAAIPHYHHRLPGHHSWDLWRAMLVDGLETVRPRLESAGGTP